MNYQWINKCQYKGLVHYERWSYLCNGGKCPQPVYVDIDPVSVCNLDCYWCNAKEVFNGQHMKKDLLLSLPQHLTRWQTIPEYPAGVRGVVVAGGGEPLLHSDIDGFLFELERNKIDTLIISNGVLIKHHIPALASCSAVGISVDAGTKETYSKLKGDYFDDIIEGMRELAAYAKTHNTRLHQGGGVAYKMLVTPENVHELTISALLAKYIGCHVCQIRPADTAWFDGTGVKWSEDQLQELQEQKKQLNEVKDFNVWFNVNKFDERLTRKTVPYNRCMMSMAYCVIRPSVQGGYCVDLCCDRRGDKSVLLLEHSFDFKDIENIWTSPKHWEIMRALDVSKCPRCKQLQNLEIIEEFVLRDELMRNLI
jgi:MoaA/NifB/PqqE/SkfB family radical SAM enzyme